MNIDLVAIKDKLMNDLSLERDKTSFVAIGVNLLFERIRAAAEAQQGNSDQPSAEAEGPQSPATASAEPHSGAAGS